ncbi:MAG TPA: hypothetical protein PK948_10445 [Gemmatimonadales bacterium]|nr:hypothetical protein [Gemmatimonadales bacterium]
MNRRMAYVLTGATLFLGACASDQLAPDRPPTGSVAAPVQWSTAALATLPTECSSEAAAQSTIDGLLPQLFGPGGGRRGKAQGYSNVIVKARREGKTALAEANVDSLVNFTLSTYYAGNLIGGQSTATQERVLEFIYLLYCSNNITPIPDLSGIFGAENTVLLRNSSPTTIVNDPLDSAAVEVEHGEVPNTIFGTFVSVYKTTNPLPTTLDWYGIDGFRQGAFEFVSNPAVTFTSPVLTGVCISYDADIVSPNDLRLAHAVEDGYVSVVPGNSIVATRAGTIEIGAYADPGPLDLACDPLPPPVVAARTSVGRAWQQLAQLFSPGTLYAAVSGGGTGSQVVKFSPFAAVDIRLAATGTGPSSPQYIPVGSTEVQATVDVTVVTRKGHSPVEGLAVAFDPGGSFAPDTTATDAAGTATASWTLTSGTNDGEATSATAPLRFAPEARAFSVTAIQLTPLSITTASLPGGQATVAYGPATLTAEGGAGTFSWGLAPGSSLPAGLTLSSAGALSGTPTSPGAFQITVRVTSGPMTADRAFSVTISPAPVIVTTASPLPDATVGVAYSQAFQATGGTGTYSWAVAGGAPPAGLTLSAAGTLGGVPSAAGTASFTIEATSGGVVGSKAFTLTARYPTTGTLVFQPGPSSSQCYALNVIMTPNIGVKVSDQGGRPLAGVPVNLVAVTNNGSKVVPSQPTALTGANGIAVFNTFSINKTGGYRLIASLQAPWPVVSTQSGKFNISPSCS